MRNINQYQWSYLSDQRRFAITYDTLHTSLQRELSKVNQTSFQNELSVHGLTAGSFKTLKTNSIAYTSIFKHLEDNLSSVLGTYFFASGYHYSGGMNHVTNEAVYSATELDQEEPFTTMFQYTSTIGRIYGNYAGIRMTFSTFMDYHSTLSSYYELSQSTNQVITSIQSNSNIQFHSYVSTKYSGIFPSSMIASQSYLGNQGVPVSFVTNSYVYFPGVSPSDLPASNPSYHATAPTDPCLSTCCQEIINLAYQWYSCIPVDVNIQSLSYRLGLTDIVSRNFSIIKTLSNVISPNYVNYLMSINDEQGFNNMDIGMNENYTISNETTGQVKLIAAKILMTDVADTGISQTVIQNPVVFDKPLGKLDKLIFKVYFDDDTITPAWLYVPAYLDAMEWNATFQIEEEIGYASSDGGWGEAPTVPIPTNPNDMNYLFLTKKTDQSPS
jgi:hypothetical protein